MNIPYGVQLFSVWDTIHDDFEGTLEKISEMGYKGVEFAGFGGKSAKEINEVLAKYNLELWSAHEIFENLVDDYEKTVAFHREVGNKSIVIGTDLETQSQIDEFVELANPIIDRLEKDGMFLGFHNHAREFYPIRGGGIPFEQLIYRTNIKFEIDTYWAFVGMGNPVQLMERLGDRVKVLHIKDGFGDKVTRGIPLGRGTAPVRDCVAYGYRNSIPMLVENETYFPSGLDEIKMSIDYLRSLEK